MKVNQPLVRLDETTARANERQVFLRRLRLESIVARLTAEAEGLPRIEYPKVILDNKLTPMSAPSSQARTSTSKALTASSTARSR